MRHFFVLSPKMRLDTLARSIGLVLIWFFTSDDSLADWLLDLGWTRLAWGVWELTND